MAFKMKGHPLKRGLYMGAKSPYPKVMDQGKLGNQLKRFQNDLREAKDEKSKRKIKDMIEATMEEMQREGMSMEQIENIGGKSAFAKTGSPAKKNTYIVKMKDGTKKKMTRKEYMKFTGGKPGSKM
tara:strand:+ start:356 stop:733 length:378 start_codon:yes stop_codon:yes gene_type:complete